MTRLTIAIVLLAVSLPQPLAAAETVTSEHGLWVWDSPPLLHDAHEREAFFDFCARHHIGVAGIEIFTRATDAGRRLDNAAEWRTLIREARRRGMRLHALDGDPHYALRSEHGTVLSIVDAVLAYNASVAPDERFYGIHLDIEPYLLPEWKEPSARERLLADYLDLNLGAAARARAAGVVYGVDIPFWWQSIDTATGEAVSITTFRGVRKSATAHLLKIVDIVGVMAYRNVAAGPDGIVTRALETLDLADNADGARTFVGVETEKVSEGVPAKVTFAGKSLEQLDAEVRSVDDVFVGRPAYAGIAIHRYVSLRQMREQ